MSESIVSTKNDINSSLVRKNKCFFFRMQNVHDNISHTIQSNTIDILLIY